MTMAPMQQANGAIIHHRQPGTETPNPAGRAVSPSALGTADDVVRARIIAAAAGITAPLSVTSAPGSDPYQAVAGIEPETASTRPLYGKRPVLPQYPPLGRYGSRLERVEAVGRFVQPRIDWSDVETGGFEYCVEQASQPDSIADAVAQPAGPKHDPAVIDSHDDGDIYRQLTLWLRTHKQGAAMRELAQLRRVLVLAPTDGSAQSWQAHLMCPAATANAIAMRAPGAEGRSWPLRAEGAWVFTESGKRWQRWRMRQHIRADGVWQLDQSPEGRHAPAWCTDDGAPQLLPAPMNGIPLHLTEPQRLRRLLGTQWTVLVLRAPEPLPSAQRR